jgi:hypothetical protein
MAEKLVPGGFLGAGLLNPAGTLSPSEVVTNAAATPLLAGEVVRINGDATVTRAQANTEANATGVVGVTLRGIPVGTPGRIVNSGYAFVLLEVGLTPVAGDPLWLSAATAGRATNVVPSIPLGLGVIKDASLYAATGGVLVDLSIAATSLTDELVSGAPLGDANTLVQPGVDLVSLYTMPAATMSAPRIVTLDVAGVLIAGVTTVWIRRRDLTANTLTIRNGGANGLLIPDVVLPASPPHAMLLGATYNGADMIPHTVVYIR